MIGARLRAASFEFRRPRGAATEAATEETRLKAKPRSQARSRQDPGLMGSTSNPHAYWSGPRKAGRQPVYEAEKLENVRPRGDGTSENSPNAHNQFLNFVY